MKKLLKYTERLKHLPRTGWLRQGIEIPETVASHSWQMAMMAMQLSGTLIKEHYDFNKLIRMCLCHDLGESIIGDVTPHDKQYIHKKDIEQSAIDCIAEEGDLPELIILFDEFEQNKTPEAKLAHDLDKLDMFVQSIDYEQRYEGKDLSEFRQTAIKTIQTPLGKAILKEIMSNMN